MGWLRALRWPSYRRVWLVATMLQFGYWFASISFQWLVARDTDNDPISLSVLYFFMLIPMLIFSLPAGVLADTRDRRSNILIAQSGVVLVGLITAALVVADHAPFGVLVACGFAAGLPVGGLILGVLWHLAGPSVALVSFGLAALLVAGVVLRPSLAREPDTGSLRDQPA